MTSLFASVNGSDTSQEPQELEHVSMLLASSRDQKRSVWTAILLESDPFGGALSVLQPDLASCHLGEPQPPPSLVVKDDAVFRDDELL